MTLVALGEIVPGSVETTVAGKKWMLAPWTIGDDAGTIRRIQANWKRPLDVAFDMLAKLKTLDDESKRTLLIEVYRDEMRGPRLTQADVDAFEQSREGTVWVFYQRAVKNHKELTLADCEKLINEEREMARANERASRLSGERPLKNSTAPDQKGATMTTTDNIVSAPSTKPSSATAESPPAKSVA